LELNDIGQISIRLAEAISVDEYADDRMAGSFLLIDPSSGNTLAAGLVGDALRAVELNRA
jgi:sulfate adenylyltransferase subunit 1